MKTHIDVKVVRLKAWQLRKQLTARRLDHLERDAKRLVQNHNAPIEFLARFLGRWLLRYRITLDVIHARWARSGHFKDAMQWYSREQEVADGVLRLCNATDEANGDGFIEIDECDAKILGYEP